MPVCCLITWMIDMVVSFGYTEDFLRQMKHLRKKYPSLEKDYAALLNELEENPFAGVDLGSGVHKVRMAIASKGKGKSGGARVITYCVSKLENDVRVNLLAVYDKSEIENVSDAYIQSLLKSID